MEQVLASFGISLKELEDNQVCLDGDFPQIWVDRPWHPLTKQEIYALVLVTTRLGFTLPQLVLEKIAFWIQLIELCKDFRNIPICPGAAGGLRLQLTFNCLSLRPFRSALTSTRQVLFNSKGAIRVEVTFKEDLDSTWNTDRIEEILSWKLRGYNLFTYQKNLGQFIQRKERYRIPTAAPIKDLKRLLEELRVWGI